MILEATLFDAAHQTRAFVELIDLPDAPVLIVTAKRDCGKAAAMIIEAQRLTFSGSGEVDAILLTPDGLDAAPIKLPPQAERDKALAALKELVRQVKLSNALDDHGHDLRNLRALAVGVEVVKELEKKELEKKELA